MTPEQSFKLIAEQEGISVSEVRHEIQLAIDEAMNCPDPKIRDFWQSIPKKGKKLSPEEAVLFLSRYVKEKNQRLY